MQNLDESLLSIWPPGVWPQIPSHSPNHFFLSPLFFCCPSYSSPGTLSDPAQAPAPESPSPAASLTARLTLLTLRLLLLSFFEFERWGAYLSVRFCMHYGILMVYFHEILRRDVSSSSFLGNCACNLIALIGSGAARSHWRSLGSVAGGNNLRLGVVGVVHEAYSFML